MKREMTLESLGDSRLLTIINKGSMDISEIYEHFDKIDCLTFATIDKQYPQTRIAHLFAFNDEGLCFRTMITKAFYQQLKETGKVSICGMFPKTTVSFRGIRITDECTECGECLEACSFKAISEEEERFVIDPLKCDVCGDCFTACPADAVEIVIDDPGE